MTYVYWLTYQWPKDKAAGILRVGQSYLNNVRPGTVYPELFYEKNEGEAWEMIMAMEMF